MKKKILKQNSKLTVIVLEKIKKKFNQLKTT